MDQWYPLEAGPVDKCLYLEGRESRLEIGVVVPSPVTFDRLMTEGYRRQGLLFYRPACPTCRECRPIRVPLDAFHPSRSQRRLMRRQGEQIEVEVARPRYHQEHFQMYAAHARRVSQDNQADDPLQYRTAFVDSLANSHMVEYRVGRRLVAVSILDEGAHTVSSVYTFWRPEAEDLSLGTFSALWEMAWAAQRGRQYYHLGYWIRDCSRMNYKNRFRPYELFDWGTQSWQRVDE